MMIPRVIYKSTECDQVNWGWTRVRIDDGGKRKRRNVSIYDDSTSFGAIHKIKKGEQAEGKGREKRMED